jgi:Flp pilus assembly protein TadG
MMRKFLSFLRDNRGSVVVETALLAPILALMSVGAFQVSQAVARQHELQTGADDAASLALAGWKQDTGDITAVKAVIRRTLALADNQVTVVRKFRCGTDAALVDDRATCAPGAIVTSYIQIHLTDTYTPMWADFGVGSPIAYDVQRLVVVS